MGSGFDVGPIVPFQPIRGNLPCNPDPGHALESAMMLIMAVSDTHHRVLRNRTEQWQK